MMRFLLIVAAFAALAACHKAEQQQPANETAAAAPGESGIKGVHRDHKDQSAPDTNFNDPDGQQTTLAEFSGKPVLVNLWATWCAPCVKELPTLDKLSQIPGAPQVVAVSQDSGPHASVAAFLDSHRITSLESYQDPKMSLSGALGAEVLPTSILYDAKGREVWRYVGDLDWTSDKAAKLLREGGAAGSH
jgi:thiol-disulfide isomerase/thioredoxin